MIKLTKGIYKYWAS